MLHELDILGHSELVPFADGFDVELGQVVEQSVFVEENDFLLLRRLRGLHVLVGLLEDLAVWPRNMCEYCDQPPIVRQLAFDFD